MLISAQAQAVVSSGNPSAWVLTAAHCATDFSSMSVKLLGGSVSRTVTSASVLPQWAGWNGTGTVLALLKLDHAVTGVAGFQISTSSHLYQDYLLAGYGYIGTGAVGGLGRHAASGSARRQRVPATVG